MAAVVLRFTLGPARWPVWGSTGTQQWMRLTTDGPGVTQRRGEGGISEATDSKDCGCRRYLSGSEGGGL